MTLVQHDFGFLAKNAKNVIRLVKTAQTVGKVHIIDVMQTLCAIKMIFGIFHIK